MINQTVRFFGKEKRINIYSKSEYSQRTSQDENHMHRKQTNMINIKDKIIHVLIKYNNRKIALILYVKY